MDSLTHLFAILQNGWTAFSFVSALCGFGGFALTALAIAATVYLPIFPKALRNLLIGTGVAVILGAVLYDAGVRKGAHDAFALDAKRAVQAETDRADAAEALRKKDQAAMAQERAAAAADTTKLKGLLDEANKRADAGRVCLPRDLSRQLRAL